jgi:hypothetical protein
MFTLNTPSHGNKKNIAWYSASLYLLDQTNQLHGDKRESNMDLNAQEIKTPFCS